MLGALLAIEFGHLVSSGHKLSPRLAWLKLHRVHTARDHLPRSPGPYNEKPWRCSNAGRTVNVYGDSEDEVIWGWCREYNVPHHDITGWELPATWGALPDVGPTDFRMPTPDDKLPDDLPGMTVATSEIVSE